MTTQSDQTIGLLELLELSNNQRLGRATNAAEDGAVALRLLAHVVPDIGRIADSLETLTALFASVIGRGTSSCGPDLLPGTVDYANVNFLRTGDGKRLFGCDDAIEADDD